MVDRYQTLMGDDGPLRGDEAAALRAIQEARKELPDGVADDIVEDRALVIMRRKAAMPCRACSYSYMHPDSPELVCGVQDIPGGTFNGRLLYPRLKSGGRGPETPICGADRPKFEQHPMRGPDGSLGRSRFTRPGVVGK